MYQSHSKIGVERSANRVSRRFLHGATTLANDDFEDAEFGDDDRASGRRKPKGPRYDSLPANALSVLATDTYTTL